MRRREFIAGLGGAAAWSAVARAQQRALPVVGLLDATSPRPDATRYADFRRGLAEAGFVDGRTVAIEYRWANNQIAAGSDGALSPGHDALARFAAELVQRQVAVIVAIDSTPTVLAAKAATSTIPIAFVLGPDPIKLGLVASLNRPGGNMTGVTVLTTELTGKRLDLLLEITPSATTVAYMTNPGVRNAELETRDMLEAARGLERQAIILEAHSELDIDAAFATLLEGGANGLVVAPHILFMTNRKKIVELAARHRIPAVYPGRFFPVDGGLMSYNADFGAAARQIGSRYVAQILRGAKPGDLPIQQPTKFKLVINLKTAETLGLVVPPALLALADEVIE